MSDLDVELSPEIRCGDVLGRKAFRLTIKRAGEAPRGIWTEVRDGEDDTEAIDRLIKYFAANDLPARKESEPLLEV